MPSQKGTLTKEKAVNGMWSILSFYGASPTRVAFLKGVTDGYKHRNCALRDFQRCNCNRRH